MPKKSKPRPKLKFNDELDDLNNRLSQFLAVNEKALTKGELTEQEKAMVEGQNTAYATVRSLIKQIKNRGDIWRGGYDDSKGSVVYDDQVQAAIDGNGL